MHAEHKLGELRKHGEGQAFLGNEQRLGEGVEIRSLKGSLHQLLSKCEQAVKHCHILFSVLTT